MEDNQLSLASLSNLLSGAVPAGLISKLAKARDPYYRGPTKVNRKRAKVVALRKAQKLARRAARGTGKGAKRTKGQRFTRAKT